MRKSYHRPGSRRVRAGGRAKSQRVDDAFHATGASSYHIDLAPPMEFCNHAVELEPKDIRQLRSPLSSLTFNGLLGQDLNRADDRVPDDMQELDGKLAIGHRGSEGFDSG